MSDFEIKYLKEVLENLIIIKKDLDYKYYIDDVIEQLEKIIKYYGG